MKSSYGIIVSTLCLATGLMVSSEAQADNIGGRYCRDANGKVYHRSSTPCPRGQTEVPNPNGTGTSTSGSPSATTRDSFAGGTGGSNLAPGTAYAIDEVNVSGLPGSLFASTLESCSKVEFRFDVQVAPGTGSGRVFSVRSDSNTGVHSNVTACNIAGTATSCAGTANFAYSPGDSLSIVEQDAGTPAASNARWAVRCTAH